MLAADAALDLSTEAIGGCARHDRTILTGRRRWWNELEIRRPTRLGASAITVSGAVELRGVFGADAAALAALPRGRR